MIFVTVGSREYPFDRLIKKIDSLCENGVIQEEVFGQIGTTKYTPENFNYKRFLDTEEYKLCQKKADIVISHAGTGALVGALKEQKQVIAVPRISEHGEHSDNHQLQVATALKEKGYLISITDFEKLPEAIDNLKKKPIKRYYNEPSNIIPIINNFIENTQNK